MIRLLLLATAHLAAAVLPAHAVVPVSRPTVSAESYLLLDVRTGTVLAERNADQPFEPASLTKIMTAYVTFRMLEEGLIEEDEEVLISRRARAAEGSRMFVEVRDQVPVMDLLRGIIVQSGNDASIALAEHIAGSEEAFAGMMNSEADRLGMTGSHFTDSSGIGGPEHVMSARDVAIVSRALIREFPGYYAMFRERGFTWNDIHQRNRNRLLWQDQTVDGIKTGYTEAARYCLAASAMRPELNDMRLVSVVLGSESDRQRTTDAHALLRWGFRFFRTEPVLMPGEARAHVRAWFAEEGREEVPVGARDELWLTLPAGAHRELTARFEPRAPIEAPIAQGQALGTLRVLRGGDTLGLLEAVALADVPEAGWTTRMYHHLLRFVE